ncbi:DUF5916 domain-containing protein [Lysobacter hankyongensis]|uniref:DUF5916 domain-containing protein n=1 Tax=Lysobacter hankyongensis TaxID=1176535 RepID=A0ABP9AJ57_9GAMM
MFPWKRAALLLFLLMAATPAKSIEIDGKIDPTEWRDAERITDFRLNQPMSLAPAPYPTEAWLMATPKGLAVAFRCTQPASIARTRQRTQRDEFAPHDRVNVYLDFDGDGRIGYHLRVSLSDGIGDATIANENEISGDWDGHWLHATSETESDWSAELLIPWHIAPMREGENGKRRLGIMLDRVVGATGERMAWPAIEFLGPRFISGFNKVEVPAYSQSLLALTPYAVGLYDNVDGSSDVSTGLDLYWKPSGRFQLGATINPDFGQVESDRLTVNFGAIETFYDEKRPFFTENQRPFDVSFGSLDSSNRLIHTRRIGSLTADGGGSTDVGAAVKFNGNIGRLNYGIFAADEDGAAGRAFYALRATRDFAAQGLGMLWTRVDNSGIDRRADVYALDHRWTLAQGWSIRSAVVGSRIEADGARMHDSGAQLRVNVDNGNDWRQQLYLLHLGADLSLNDFGYLARNNLNEARYSVSRRFTAPRTAGYAAIDWELEMAHLRDDRGNALVTQAKVNRAGNLLNGGQDYLSLSGSGSYIDDLITRGNGSVRLPPKLSVYYERFSPKQENRSVDWFWYARYFAEGPDGVDSGGVELYVEPKYHFSDHLNVSAGLLVQRNPDWLLWLDGDRLATYASDLVQLNLSSVWMIGSRQELRVRLEALGLDADARRGLRARADATLVPIAGPVADFALRTLGFQIRYRYELAPLSHLYIAYVRGGSFANESLGGVRGAGEEFLDAFSLRDSEQLLIKLVYRFEI